MSFRLLGKFNFNTNIVRLEPGAGAGRAARDGISILI